MDSLKNISDATITSVIDTTKATLDTITTATKDTVTAVKDLGEKTAKVVTNTTTAEMKTLVDDTAQPIKSGLSQLKHLNLSEMKNNSFKMVMIFYLIVIIGAGYGSMDLKANNAENKINALYGMVIGALLSAFLWVVVGSDYVKSCCKAKCGDGYHYHPNHPKADKNGCMKNEDMKDMTDYNLNWM